MNDWSKVKHFTPNEPWGDASKIDENLVLTLDLYRELIGIPIYVTFGTQGEHVAEWHKRGIAVDFVVDLAALKFPILNPLDLIIMAMRLPLLKGLGIYPMAKHPKCEKPLGFHMDTRPGGGPTPLWIAIPSKEPGKLITQIALNSENLRKFNLL